MRKLLYGAIALVVVLVGAALAVPSMIDWNSWKGEIAARAKEATGRDLIIAGDLDLAVLPSPRLSVHDVRLRNLPGASDPDMAVLRALDVRIRFAPLLSGRVEVESVTLVDPVIRLEKLADGRANWDFRQPGAKGRPAGAGKPATGGGSGDGGTAVRLDAVRIVNGTLVWRDAAAGSEERIETLNATIAARSLSGPFKATGSLIAHKMPLSVDLAVGRMADGAPLPLSLRTGVAGTDAKLVLNGAVKGLDATPVFEGRVEADGSSLRDLVSIVAPHAGPLPGYLGQNFGLRAELAGGAEGGTADGLELSLGGARAAGQASFTGGDRPRATVKLHASSVDLDKWLAMPSAAEKTGGPPGGGSAAPKNPKAAAAAPFALPKGMNVTAELRVDAATWQSQAMRDIRVQAALTEGELTLSQASLRLPGEAEASLFGFLTEKGGRPAFDGTVEARADNLRGTLDWLKIDVSQVPADRLRKFALSAKIRGDDRQMQVLDAKISLDTSRIDGGVTLALRERPAFGATVSINQLNLDAYLPPAPKGTDAARDARTPTGAPVPLVAGAKPDAAPRGPLAALNDFDANMRLRIGALTLRQTAVQGVQFDGTLAHGRLTVRDAAVQSLAGTSASLKGELSGFDGLPVFRGEFAADSKNLAGLLRVAGLEKTLSARRLGTMRLRGKADGGAEKVTMDTSLDIAGGRLAFKGAMEGLTGQPAVNGTLSADYRELTDLTAALGGADGGRKLGPLAANVTVGGGVEAMTAQGRVRAVGGELSFGGRLLNALTAPTYDLNVNAANPELRDLLRVVAPDYRPAASKIGAFRLEASLKGDAEKMQLNTFKVSAGPASVSGEGTMMLTGKRPSLTATLTGGVLDLNPLLPASDDASSRVPAAAPVGPQSAAATPAAAGRYSSEPIDLAAMDLLDANVTLGANALIWRNFRVDNPTVKATLQDRLLTLQQVAGRLFDGDFLLKGRLDGRKTPALEANLKIDQANVGKALFQAADFDVAGGKLDFRAALTASGVSEKALVAALDGQGELKVRDGVVKGFDLKAVSDRLKTLDSGFDFLRLFGASMNGGQTAFSALDGTFKVTKGVVRSDDMKLVADAGIGTATGEADLPRWTIDAKSEFRLTEHKNAPPFGMELHGPIDKPNRVFKFEQLQTFLLQRGVGTLLRKALPGAKQEGGAQEQSGQQQQQQQKPGASGDDLLRGIFDALRKKK